MDVLAGRLPDLLLRLALVRLQRQPRGLPQQAPRPPGQSLHPQGRGAHHQLHLSHSGKDLGLDQISMLYVLQAFNAEWYFRISLRKTVFF